MPAQDPAEEHTPYPWRQRNGPATSSPEGGAEHLMHTARLDRSLAASIVGTLILRCASGAMGLMVGLYLSHINDFVQPVSASLYGTLAASFFATELLASPIFGAQSDRLGRKPFMVLGALFGAAALQITAMTTYIPLLLVTRLLEGLSSATAVPATLSYISAGSSASPTLRGQVVSLFEIATIAGLAVGGLVGGRFWDWWGPAGFTAVSGMYLLSAATFFWGVRPVRARGEHQQISLRRYVRLITQPDLLRFMPAWLAINAILGVWLNHLSFQMSGVRPDPNQFLVGGFSGSMIGVILAMYALTFSAGILLWGRAFGRMRKTDMMLIALGGLFVVCLSSFAINHTGRSNTAIMAILLVPLTAGILVESGFTPAALGYLADLSEEYVTDRGAIMGLYSVLLALGQLGGAWLGGPFADWGRMDGIILLTALLGLASLVTVLHLQHTHERRSTPGLTDAG